MADFYPMKLIFLFSYQSFFRLSKIFFNHLHFEAKIQYPKNLKLIKRSPQTVSLMNFPKVFALDCFSFNFNQEGEIPEKKIMKKNYFFVGTWEIFLERLENFKRIKNLCCFLPLPHILSRKFFFKFFPNKVQSEKKEENILLLFISKPWQIQYLYSINEILRVFKIFSREKIAKWRGRFCLKIYAEIHPEIPIFLVRRFSRLLLKTPSQKSL